MEGRGWLAGSKVVEESSDLSFMARSWVGRESREKAWSRGQRKLRQRGYLAISLIACSGCKGPG